MRSLWVLVCSLFLESPWSAHAQTIQPTEGSPEPASAPDHPVSMTLPPIAPVQPIRVPMPPRLPAPPAGALVHIGVDHPRARLEARSSVDDQGWQFACATPCDRGLPVDGVEFRVTAPGMTASNVFRIEAGRGVARLKVSGGSADARTAGLVLLIAGLPVTFGGMTLFGVGAFEHESAVRTVGIITIATGAAAIASALPLLLAGSTTVRNDKGEAIAAAGARPVF